MECNKNNRALIVRFVDYIFYITYVIIQTGGEYEEIYNFKYDNFFNSSIKRY